MKNITITYTSRAETIRVQKARLKVRVLVFAVLFTGLFSYKHSHFFSQSVWDAIVYDYVEYNYIPE